MVNIMKTKIISVILTSLLVGGCIQPPPPSTHSSKTSSIMNYGNVNDIATGITKNCGNIDDQCWNSLNNFTSGNITMEGQISKISDGKVYVNTSFIFKMQLPTKVPMILIGINNQSLQKLKVGKQINFVSRVKPLSPSIDAIKFAILTAVIPESRLLELKKYTKMLETTSKVVFVVELYDVTIEEIR